MEKRLWTVKVSYRVKVEARSESEAKWLATLAIEKEYGAPYAARISIHAKPKKVAQKELDEAIEQVADEILAKRQQNI